MREKHLLQFICKIQPKNSLIPTQVYYDEAYYQRDMYRDKLRDYYANQRDKKLLPSGLPQTYIQPIMQNLERRSERPLQKRADGSYLYPKPAYLVLAAWSFILSRTLISTSFLKAISGWKSRTIWTCARPFRGSVMR